MAQAVWNGQVIAESDVYEVIEGNLYFPRDAINDEFFRESETHTSCFWKGDASYYTDVVDGKENRDAAWYYPDPSQAAVKIKDHIAFWRGVHVTN